MSSILTNTSAMVALQTMKSINTNLNRTQQEIPNAETMARTESDAIKIVLGAARKLI